MTRPDLDSLRAAVTAAEAERDAAQKRLQAAKKALTTGLQDDWIARAREAMPIPEGGVEGWVTENGENWYYIPEPPYSTLRMRLVATGAVIGKTIEVTVQQQRRTPADAVEAAPWATTTRKYQLRTDEGKAWAKRFGVTA